MNITKKNITNEMIEKLKDTYKGDKNTLQEMNAFINENGVLDNGLTDINETFEMGYNNALEYVFAILGIENHETNNM